VTRAVILIFKLRRQSPTWLAPNHHVASLSTRFERTRASRGLSILTSRSTSCLDQPRLAFGRRSFLFFLSSNHLCFVSFLVRGSSSHSNTRSSIGRIPSYLVLHNKHSSSRARTSRMGPVISEELCLRRSGLHLLFSRLGSLLGACRGFPRIHRFPIHPTSLPRYAR